MRVQVRQGVENERESLALRLSLIDSDARRTADRLHSKLHAEEGSRSELQMQILDLQQTLDRTIADHQKHIERMQGSLCRSVLKLPCLFKIICQRFPASLLRRSSISSKSFSG
jgi:hypothetical protein